MRGAGSGQGRPSIILRSHANLVVVILSLLSTALGRIREYRRSSRLASNQIREFHCHERTEIRRVARKIAALCHEYQHTAKRSLARSDCHCMFYKS